MQLNEKHYKCIELLIKGLKHTEIAKLVPCSRQSIYDWLKDKDFVNALDNCRQEIKIQSENRILAKVDTYLDKIEQIAFNSVSDNVKLNALTFLYEQVNGKATSKVQQTITDNREETNTNISLDDMIASLPVDNTILKEDNIVSINDIKRVNQ